MTRWMRLVFAGLAVVATTGCAFDAFVYSSDRYGAVKGVAVTLRCRDTYEVFDRVDAATLLVGTNGLNEVLVGCIDGGSPPLPVRQREVAQLFLAEKTNRPLCRIVRDTEISATLREFAYRCPTVAAPRLRRDIPPPDDPT